MSERTLRAQVRRWVACFLAVAPLVASAQYPAKPITLIVPFASATASDLAARIVAGEMATAMGQPVIVQNRPGANSAIGAAAVASAAPDGYTLLLATAGTAALPALNKSVPFDIRSLTPIAFVCRFPVYLYVNVDQPSKSLAEFIEQVRANPGKLYYATGNPVGIAASAQLFAMAGNLSLVHVPYKGEPAAVVDLAANRVQVMVSTPSSAEPFVKTGRLRALATILPQRSPYAPELPSVNESFPRYTVTAWAGFMGPPGLPRELVDRLAREVTAAVARPAAKEQFAKLQFVGAPSTPETFADFYREQLETYARVLREAGVQPE